MDSQTSVTSTSKDAATKSKAQTVAIASTSGYWATVINITKAFVGAASFELPKAVSDGGLFGACLGIVFLAFLCHFSLSRLARCSHLVSNTTKPTYPMIGAEACGLIGKVVAWFGMLAMTVGVCGSFVVFMVSRLQVLTGLNQDIGLCIVFLLVTLLSWLRTYSALAYTSFFGLLALVFALCVQTFNIFQQEWVPLTELEPFVRPDTYGSFLGNAGFLYLISTAVLPLEQSMHEEERPHFGKALGTSMVFVTVVNIAFAVSAYWGYGDCYHYPQHCVKGLVVDNLPPGMLTDAVNVLLSIDLLFTCVVFLLPMSQLLEKELMDESRFGETFVEFQRNVLRTALVAAISIVAYSIPIFDLLTSLSGGFGNNILGLILPPFFYVVLKRWKAMVSTKASKMELMGCIFSAVFGTAFLILTLFTFVKAMQASPAA